MRVVLTHVVAAAIILGACSRSREYELRGQVVAIDSASAKITVKHEDIRGFMPAMTMQFTIRDRALLQGREPGELITATLVVETDGAYLSSIRRTGMAPIVDVHPPAPVNVLQNGETVPDAGFTDQAGRARRLSNWRGQVVAVTFIYTRCPIPDFCPLMDRNFGEIQREIASDAALRGRVHLLSISIDPEYDTPKVLAAHADHVSADREHWTLLRGEGTEFDAFTSKFGVSVVRPTSGRPAETSLPVADIVHNLRTAVIDAQGRVVTIISGNEWTPADLLGHIRSALR